MKAHHVIRPQASRDRESHGSAPACQLGHRTMVGRLHAPQIRKASRDTTGSCNERAAADLAAAAATDNENIRRRFERSAESWKARAEMLRFRDTE
jgi:hypothetical protein